MCINVIRTQRSGRAYKTPALEEAEAATGRYLCYADHNLPTCFVCGPGRSGHDGLGLFPGPISSWDLLACPWSPGVDLLDDAGDIRPEIVPDSVLLAARRVWQETLCRYRHRHRCR
jgi:hypothetical protein